MDISEVIQETGLAASRLRYYEELGLISSVGRKGLRRQYHDDVIERLAFVTLAQGSGFSLSEIAELLIEKSAGKKQLRRDMLQAKAKELDQKIKELCTLRDGLKHAALCPAPSHFECPQFLRLLKIAKRKRNKAALVSGGLGVGENR